MLIPVFYSFVPVTQGDTEYLSDPAKYLLEYLGLSATVIYIATMAVSPLRAVFPQSDVVRAFQFHRRQMGVSVFVYAVAHVVVYYFYTGSWAEFFRDWDKLFIISGAIALALLAALAATSNNWAVRKLGGKRWKRLHYLAHVVMFLLIYHQAAQEKTGFRETATLFAPLIALQAYRIGLAWRRRALRAGRASD